MMTKIPASGGGGGGRNGSCSGLVDYLEKEQAGLWFDQQQALLAGHEVTAAIDGNKRNLGRADDKYYQLILAPSQAELAHIGGDAGRLETYTRAVMEQYAANFGKGIGSADLLWFAKIEHSRHFDYTDRAVQLGEQPRGLAKPGDQTHIHIIVSRTEQLRAYTEGKKKGTHQRKNPYHLSPLTHHKATTKGPVVGGFERNAFSQRAETTFDETFGYGRSVRESFRFLHGMKYGDEAAKAAWQRLATTERAPQAPPHQTGQGVAVPPLPSQSPDPALADALRTRLGQAYEQKDVNELSAALTTAQAEGDRQREQARQPVPARTELTQQPPVAQPPQRPAQKIDEEPPKAPRIKRGLGR